MKFMFSKKNLLVKVFVVLILVALLISINPVVVHAWKTRSHVYSANLILEELELNEKDGKYYVTIDPFGKFEVPKEFSDALFEYPDAFRAGTIGPDLFPDMLTGQTLIHTYDDFRMISSGDWLNHLVNSVNQLPKDSKERKEALAFTLGFMAHYAGDMFGHDFVNSFADGKFPSLSQFDGVSKAVEKDLADRIVKHMAFETYMDALVPSDYVVGEKNDVSAPVRFMLDTMYYAGGPNNGTSQILKRYEELPSTLSYLVEFRYKLFTLAEDARYVYEAFTEMFVAYVDCWIADLDEAVEQLVFSFNRIAMNLAGKPKKAVVLPDHTIGYVDKTDFEVIEEEMRDWFWYYGIYASPFPDVVGALLSFPVIVVDKLKSAFNISEAESGYDQFKDTLLDPAKIILGSIITGLSYSNVERIKNIDPEDPLASFEEGTDKYEIEAILKTFGTGVRDGKLIEQPTAQNQEFEPFYNTLQMIKLVLIGPDGYSKLLNQFPSYGKNTVYKMNSGEFKTTRIKLDIKTKDVLYAGTDANIWCCVRDREAKQSVRKLLDISAYNDMERGDLDTYFIELNWFASVENLEIWFESSGINDDWNIGYVKATPMNGSVELMTKNIISDFILKKDDKTPSSKITSNSYTYTTNLSSGILDYIETLDGSEQWDAKNNILYSNVGFRRNIFNRIFKGFENEIYQVDNSYDESTDKLAFEVFLLPKRNGLYETDRYSSTHRKLPAPTGKVRVYVEDKVQPSGKRYIGAYSVSKTNDIPDGIDLTPNPFSYIKDPLKYKVLRNLKMFYKSSFTVSSPKAGNAVYYFEYEGDDNYSASYYETTVHVGKYKVDHVEEAAMYYGSSTKISIANRSTNGKELDIEYRIKNDEYNVFSVVSGTERYYNPFAGMVTIKADYDERAVADLDYQATLELYDKLSKKTLSSIVLKASLDRITDFSRINLIKKNNVVLPNDLSNTIDIEVGDILQIKGQNLVKHQNDNFYYAWKITERGRNIHYIEDDAADRKFIFSDTGTYDIDYVQYYIKENKAFNITTNSIVVNVYAGHLITKNVSVNPYFDTYNDYYQGGVLPEIKFNVYENGTLINAEDIEYTYINMNESLHNVYKIVDEEGNPVDALTPGTYKCAPTKGYYYETIVYNKKTNVSYIYNISYSEITINVKDGTVDENKNKGSIHRLPGYTSDLFDELKIVHISNDSGIIPYPPVGFTICDGLGRKIAISEGKTNKAVFPSGFFFSDLNINSYGARLFIPYPEGTSMKDEFIQYIKWNEQTRKFATVAEFSDDPNMLIEKTRYGLLLFVMEEFSYELAVSNSHSLTLRDINGLESGVTTDEYAYSSIVTLKRKDSSLIFNNWVVPNDVEILSGTLKSDEIKIKMPNKDIVIDCIYSDNVPVRFETIGGGNAHTVEGVSNFYQLPECMFLVPSGKYLSYWRDKDSNELYRAGDYVNIDHLHTFETVWDDVEAITSLDIRTTKDIAPVAEANISLASSVDELYDLLNRNSLFTICGDLTTDNYWALSNNSYYGPLTDTSIQFMPSSSYRLALKLKPSSRYTFDRLYVNNYTLNGVGCCSYIDNGDSYTLYWEFPVTKESLTGNVEINGLNVVSQSLSVSVIDGNNTGVLSYRWIDTISNTELSNESILFLKASYASMSIKCIVRDSDHPGQIESAETIIAALPPREAPDFLTISRFFDFTYLVTDGRSDMEYSFDEEFPESDTYDLSYPNAYVSTSPKNEYLYIRFKGNDDLGLIPSKTFKYELVKQYCVKGEGISTEWGAPGETVNIETYLLNGYHISNMISSHPFHESTTPGMYFLTMPDHDVDILVEFEPCVYDELWHPLVQPDFTSIEHNHMCTICGQVELAGNPHNPGPEATEESPQVCLDCGYVITPILNHVCEYTEIVQGDVFSGHYYVCKYCHASNGVYYPHTGGVSNCVTCHICEDCGLSYGTYGDHDYSGKGYSLTEHWDFCIHCYKIINDEKHHGGHATCTELAKCDICNNEYGQLENHDFIIPQVDNEYHWIKCYNCETIAGKEHHIGGSATCEEAAVCEYCNAHYGDLANHHGGSATCTSKAICDECHKEYGELAVHDYSDHLHNDYYHYDKCANCDSFINVEEHHGGAATCTSKAICDECHKEYGALAEHDYSVHLHNETHHYDKCANCDSIVNNERHYGGSATCTSKAKCDVCNTEYGTLKDHDYSIPQIDKDYHYAKCSECGALSEKVRHTGGSATCTSKAICDVCHALYGDLLHHDYSAHLHDETYHYDKCANCDSIVNKEKHHGGSASCTSKAICDVCNAEYGSITTHNYEWVIDKPSTNLEMGIKHEECTLCYDKKNEGTLIPVNACVHSSVIHTPQTDSTCTINGKEEYWYCSDCKNYYSDALCKALIVNIETFGILDLIEHSGGAATCTSKAICDECHKEYGVLAEHDYSVHLHNETHHYDKCANCDSIVNNERHYGGSATCTSKAKCDVCNTEYGTIKDHDYSIPQIDKDYHYAKCSECGALSEKVRHTGGSATCTSKAICDVCHALYGDLLPHDYSAHLHDETYHYDKCANCDSIVNKEKHHGGSATCTSKAICDVCNAEYGSITTHNYEWVIDKPSTNLEMGIKHEECTLCHDKKNEGTLIPFNACVHSSVIHTPQTDSTCTINGKEEYWYCSDCKNYYSDALCKALIVNIETFGILDLIEHSGGAATCTSKAICDECHKEYGVLAEHDYSVHLHNETHHYDKCANCDSISNNERHYGGSATCTSKAKCDVCNTEYGTLKDHDYSIPQIDKDYHYAKCSECGALSEKVRHTGGSATCTSKAICDVCHALYGDLLPHDYSAHLHDETYHYDKCANCDSIVNKEKHHGGTASCTSKAICDVCNTEYGSITTHNYEWVIDKPADKAHSGLKHEECTICHDIKSENTKISPLSYNVEISSGTATISLNGSIYEEVDLTEVFKDKPNEIIVKIDTKNKMVFNKEAVNQLSTSDVVLKLEKKNASDFVDAIEAFAITVNGKELELTKGALVSVEYAPGIELFALSSYKVMIVSESGSEEVESKIISPNIVFETNKLGTFTIVSEIKESGCKSAAIIRSILLFIGLFGLTKLFKKNSII